MKNYNMTKRHDALLMETVYKIKHPCGLEIQFMPKPGYTKKFAYFATRYGALYNAFEMADGKQVTMPLGIAHFLEHKIFEDAEGDIFDKFSKLGANVNAYTSFNATSYMFSTVDNFYESLGLLLDFVQDCHLTDENVEKEKGIISQEIKMYDDDPDWRVYFNTLKKMYHNHPVREDVAGSTASVTSTTRDQLQLCYDSFYVPENMILFIIGDLDLEAVMETVEEHLAQEYKARGKAPQITIPWEPKSVSAREVRQKMDVPIPLFQIGFKDTVKVSNPKEAMKRTIAVKLGMGIHFGKSSAFYTDMYKAGLINASFYYEYSSGMDYAHVMFGGEARDYDAVIQGIKEEIKRIHENGMDYSGFERVKRKAIGRYLSSFNSVQYVAGAFVSYFMKEMDLFDYLVLLEEMTPEYVEETLRRHLTAEHEVLSVVE